jgi:hypothetical protein
MHPNKGDSYPVGADKIMADMSPEMYLLYIPTNVIFLLRMVNSFYFKTRATDLFSSIFPARVTLGNGLGR